MRTLLAIILFAVLCTPARAQSGPVRYVLDCSRAPEQLLSISLTLAGVPRDKPLDIHLPVWRPGLYLVLDQSGTVRDVRAEDARGNSIPIAKSDKSTWRLDPARLAGASVTIRYTVWAGSLENRTRHADDTHAFVSPSAVFMYSPAWRALPAEVSIIAPEQWSIASGLDPAPSNPRTLLAPDYDTLVDSPIEVGIHELQRFDVDGTPHELMIWTGVVPPTERLAPLPRFKRFADDLAAILRVQKAIFGSLPYSRYLFLMHVYPAGRGGTEHLNSTVIQCTADAFTSDESYHKLLALCAHETFHTWNVKRFRPRGLVPYDYQRENYTDLLWLAEGTTSYYEDITLLRAGLIKPADFFKSLAPMIDAEQTRPGTRAQSLSESSFDAWVKFNRRTPDAPNSTVSFYDKGALASMLLDLELRRRSQGARSLDDLMRQLFVRFPDPARGYAADDVRAILNDLAGDFSPFFARAIDGAEPLDFDEPLRSVGLQIHRDAKPAPGDPRRDLAPFAGLAVKDHVGLALVDAVTRPGPAADAGLIPGDLLIAIDGTRARADAFDKTIDRHAPGDTLRISFFRHDALRETTLTLATRPAGKLTVRPHPDATPEQRAAFHAWTGVDLPKPKPQTPADADASP
ncbi:MAG: M61 family metallopeptidase [Phycisphaerales bacterium]